VQVFPSAQYYKRAGFPLKKICQYAAARGFTDVLVANEDRKSVNGLLLIHLPGGPTAHFRLSKLVLSKDIKVGVAFALKYHLAECDVSLGCMHALRPAGAQSSQPIRNKLVMPLLQGHGRATSHKPEMILSGFGTRLGHRISRVFAALFAQASPQTPRSTVQTNFDSCVMPPQLGKVQSRTCCDGHVSRRLQDPAYRGRRVVTFHNQRDFIFFR
jgi:ribosome production factor 1